MYFSVLDLILETEKTQNRIWWNFDGKVNNVAAWNMLNGSDYVFVIIFSAVTVTQLKKQLRRVWRYQRGNQNS